MIFVEVEGEAELEAAVQRLIDRASPAGLSQFLVEVDQYLLERVELRFANEGDSTVGRWAGLKAQTGRIRRNKGFSALHPINVRTGELRNFVARSSEIRPTASGASIMKPARGGNRELQNKLRHAQTGGVSNEGNAYPARPVLGLDGKDADWIVDRLWKFFEDAINTGATP